MIRELKIVSEQIVDEFHRKKNTFTCEHVTPDTPVLLIIRMLVLYEERTFAARFTPCRVLSSYNN